MNDSLFLSYILICEELTLLWYLRMFNWTITFCWTFYTLSSSWALVYIIFFSFSLSFAILFAALLQTSSLVMPGGWDVQSALLYGLFLQVDFMSVCFCAVKKMHHLTFLHIEWPNDKYMTWEELNTFKHHHNQYVHSLLWINNDKLSVNIT